MSTSTSYPASIDTAALLAACEKIASTSTPICSDPSFRTCETVYMPLDQLQGIARALQFLLAPVMETCEACGGTGKEDWWSDPKAVMVLSRACFGCQGSGCVEPAWLVAIRKAVEDAPHSWDCKAWIAARPAIGLAGPFPCNCWKSTFSPQFESLIARLTAAVTRAGGVKDGMPITACESHREGAPEGAER